MNLDCGLEAARRVLRTVTCPLFLKLDVVLGIADQLQFQTPSKEVEMMHRRS
jgi:hypothetical protein